MGVVRRQSILYSIVLYGGIAIGFVNTVLILPNILEEDQFGLTRILISAATVVAQFAQIGVTNTLVKYHPFFKEAKRNKVLSIGFLIVAIGLFVTLTLLLIFKEAFVLQYEDKSRLFTSHFHLLIPFTVGVVFFNMFDAYLRSIFKNVFSAFLNNILLRLLWLGVTILYYLGCTDFNSFIIHFTYCQVLISVLTMAYLVYLRQFQLTFTFSQKDLNILKSISGFSLFSILSGISLFLINKIDILMLGKFIGLEAVAIYAIASYMGTVILVPSRSIARTATVLVANAFKENDMATIKRIYEKTSINQLIFGSIVFILILLNFNNLTSFLPGNYAKGFWVFFFLGISKIIDTGLGINGVIILNSRYYKFDTLFSGLLLVITVLFNLYFIPIYGMVGAALATALALVLFNVAKYLFLKIKFQMSPLTSRTLVALLICGLSFIIPYSIPDLESVYTDAVVRSFAALALFLPLTYYSKISPEFSDLIDKLLKRI